MLFTPNLFAQQITGMVTGSDGDPLIGATVVVQGTTMGTVTDINGQFQLNDVGEGATLVISFTGYQAREVPALDGMTVVLQQGTSLDEIIVVGYGTESNRRVTGAVQQIDTEELSDIPVSQITQKLQGQLAGVQINQTTGKPGQGMQVRVRGQASILAGSDPLYVVDGFPIVGDINTINPDEIESISVLKDASSTSLYGSRAANGVVLITTKSGKLDQNELSLNVYAGFQSVPQKGRPKMMNGQEFAQFKKESYEDLGQDVPAAFQNPAQYGDGYDWYDGMLRTAPIQSYNLTWTSRREHSSVAIIGGYFDQDGVMVNSGFKRYSLRANSTFRLSDRLNLGGSIAPSYSVDNIPSSDGAFYATNINATVPGGLITNSLLTWPIFPYENEDGSLPLTAWIPGVSAFPTPNWFRAAKEVKNETKQTRILANLFAELDILPGLAFKTTINGDLGNTSFLNFNPSTSSTTFAALPPVVPSSIRRNSAYTTWLNENTLTYSHTFGDHYLEVLLGASYQEFHGEEEQLFLSNFPDDRINTVQSALNINRTQSFSNINEWSLISYFSRVNYNFKGKYLLTLALRRDGSSRFGSNNRWGNFPSASVGWVVSDEPFLTDATFLSFLKLRASYGLIGNNNIGNYTQYALVNNSINSVFGNTIASGAAITTLGNSDLGWERTRQFDIGFDLHLFDNFLEITYDYYKKRTTDLLFNVAIPQESGFTNFNDNVGEIEFWGHEIALAANLFTRENFSWTARLNLAFNRNEVIELAEGVERIYSGFGNYDNITMPGEALGQFWGLIHEGVYVDQADFDANPKAPESQVGTAKFADVNEDGEISFGGDEDDRTFIGNPFPDYIFGFTSNFRFFNFDLGIVLSGSIGNDIAVTSDQATTNLDGVFNVLKAVENRWRSPDNPGDGLYGKTTAATFMERDWFNSRFIQDGSYLTVKNITLGYSFPVQTVSFLTRARLYLSVQQAFVFTSYKGVNPEVSTSTTGQQTNALSLGFDFGTYPVPRTITFGANLSF